ncbi:MAG: FkbM family methyltransferase [Ginsengibacter sp.]
MTGNKKIDTIINSPTEIEFELKSFLNLLAPVVIFDIGACTGEDSIRYAKLFPNADIYSFEPREDNIEIMKGLLKDYGLKNITIVPVALSENKGIAKFYLSSGNPQNRDEDWDHGNKSSSLFPPSKHMKEYFSLLEFNSFIEVETDTLEDYCGRNNIFKIDLIHMDVQGAELSVLKGAKNMLSGVKLIWLEVENVALYENQPLRSDIETFMKENDFLKIKDTSVGAIYGDCLFLNERLLKKNEFLFKKYLPYLMKKNFKKLKRKIVR